MLYFYPTDDTPACTAQACNLRDNNQILAQAGYKIIGISPDPVTDHQKFIGKYGLNFPLIADTDLAVHHLYGIWRLKNLYGRWYMGTVRTTFLINEAGIITKIIAKVKTVDHAAQVLAAGV